VSAGAFSSGGVAVETQRHSGRAERLFDSIMKAAVIVLAGLWIYSPSYHGDWLWDDDQAITVNQMIQSPSGIFKIWTNPDGADYFPLTTSATWLQWQCFGPNATGYHAVTIAMHILTALLVWRLFQEMKLPGAWLGGLLFAIHPICVESVAWVSELKNTLSTPLFLLSAIHYLRFDSQADSASPRAVRNYGLSALFFLLAMLSKTAMVGMPIVILLHAWWKRGTVTRRDLVVAAPFFAISLVLGLVTIWYQHGRAIGQEKIIIGDIWTVAGFLQRMAIAGMATLFYLWKTIWPFDLLPIYPRWDVDPPKLWQFLPWPLMAAAGWWLWSRRGTAEQPTPARHTLFALGYFVLMLLPILGFITISYMRITWVADHFLYLPMISIIGLASAAIATWFSRASESERPMAVATGAILLAVLAYASFRYAHAWANEDALWSHTLKTNHDAWQAHNRLGAKKFARGDVEGAHYHFQNSTRLRPDLGETHNNLGTTLSAKGQLNEAIKEFTEAARVTPHVPAIRVNLANSLAAAGRFGEAGDQYRILLQTEPNNPALLNNFGVTLYKLGKKEEAIAEFRKALAIAPNLKDARESLAVALGEKPDPSAANPQTKSAPQLELNAPASPTLGPAVLP
jgi:Flp pilus assembly protein TadD